jgi:hypothetical protein
MACQVFTVFCAYRLLLFKFKIVSCIENNWEPSKYDVEELEDNGLEKNLS